MTTTSLSPASWANFEPEFRNNRGFKTFAADHSGGSYTSGAPWWGGNSDIHDCYTAVRGGLAGLVGLLNNTTFETRPTAGDEAWAVSRIGNALLEHYNLVFETLSVVLLLAIIGAILIARRDRTPA